MPVGTEVHHWYQNGVVLWGGIPKKPKSGASENTIMQFTHQLHEHKVEKRFDLMHWWLLLKGVPKWETLCDEGAKVASTHLKVNETGVYFDSSSYVTPTTPVTPSSPINSGSEDTPTKKEGGLLCPIGRKAAKRKAKEKVEDPVLDIISKELA